MKLKKRPSHEYLMMMRYFSNLCLIDLLSASVTLHTLKVNLMLSMLGKNFSRLHFKIFFVLVFAENRICHFIVSP